MNPDSAVLIHELKTPIINIQRLAKVALSELQTGGDVVERLEQISHQSQRVVQLLSVWQFMCAMRNREPITPKLSRVSLVEIRRSITEILNQFGSIYQQRGILHLVREDWIDPELMVLTDPECLEQAIYSVIDNAFRYAYPKTKVSVDIVARQKTVTISVSNTGLPLTDQECLRVFEKNWRSPSAAATSHEGNGLGLYLAQLFVQAMGGSISVSPTNEQNVTTFNFTLPRSL